MVVYYINKTSDTVNECGFPVKQGDICLLLQKFDVKTIYIDSPVEADSIWRDFRFLDNKSLKSVQFPKTNVIICRPTSNGKATGDAVLLQNLIECCTGEWLKDFLSETLSILNGFNTYWDIDGLKRFTRDNDLVMQVEEAEESKTSSSEEEGSGLRYTDSTEEEILYSSEDDSEVEADDVQSRKDLAYKYRLLIRFCLEALIDFNPEAKVNHMQVMGYLLRGHSMEKAAEYTSLTKERVRQIFEKYVKETRENKERLTKELKELREENRKLRFEIDFKLNNQDNAHSKEFASGNFDSLLSKHLDELDLPVRAKSVLRAMRVKYLGDIPKLSELELFRQPNCGRKTIKDIKSCLEVYNLRLGMTHNGMMFALSGDSKYKESQTEVDVSAHNEESSDKNVTKYYCIPKKGGVRTETSVRVTRPLPADKAEVLFTEYLRDKGIPKDTRDRMVNSLKVDFANLVNTHIQPEELSPFFSYTSVIGIKAWFDSLQYLRPMEYYDPGKLNDIKEAIGYYTECLKDDRQVVLRRQLRDEFENAAKSAADESIISINEATSDKKKTETQLTAVNVPQDPEKRTSRVEEKSKNEREISLTCDSFEDYLVLHYSNLQVPFKLQILGKINKVLQDLYGNEAEELIAHTDIEEAEIVKEDIFATDWYQQNVQSMQRRIESLVNDYLMFLREQRKATELTTPIKDRVDEFVQSLRVIEHNVRLIATDDTSAYDYIKYYSEEIDKIQRKIDNYQIKLAKKTNSTLPQEDLQKRLHAVKQLAEAASLLNECTIYDMLSQIDYGNPVKCEEFSLEEVITVLNNWDSESSTAEDRMNKRQVDSRAEGLQPNYTNDGKIRYYALEDEVSAPILLYETSTRPLDPNKNELLFRNFLLKNGIWQSKAGILIDVLKNTFAEIIADNIQYDLKPFFFYTSCKGIRGWYDSMPYTDEYCNLTPKEKEFMREAVNWYDECMRDKDQMALRKELREQFNDTK